MHLHDSVGYSGEVKWLRLGKNHVGVLIYNFTKNKFSNSFVIIKA